VLPIYFWGSIEPFQYLEPPKVSFLKKNYYLKIKCKPCKMFGRKKQRTNLIQTRKEMDDCSSGTDESKNY
jgi:hypothetical protein